MTNSISYRLVDLVWIDRMHNKWMNELILYNEITIIRLLILHFFICPACFFFLSFLYRLEVYEEIISSEGWKWSHGHLHGRAGYEQTYLYLFASVELTVKRG